MTAPVTERCCLYEQVALRQAAGDAIRPGGLELTDEALALVALRRGVRVLDVGCGPGITVEHLAAQHGLVAAGVDPSRVLLQAGRARNARLPLARARGEHLPVAANSQDAVLVECSLSVMDNPEKALGEFHRVLKPGGKLVISDLYARQPGGASALGHLPLISCLSGAWSRQDLVSRLEAHGFQPLLWQDRSQAYRQFVARLILAHGSLDSFWCSLLPAGSDLAPIRQAIAAARPGYFLCIAQREA